MRVGRIAGRQDQDSGGTLLLASAPTISSLAQEAAPFYRGKTVRIVISTGVAGGYAEYNRLLADPGGLLAANYRYTRARRTARPSASCIRAFRSRRSGATRGWASTA
jgi:hypothetical protein